jgi:RnfABCDGE-type electron transport complex G subunit
MTKVLHILATLLVIGAVSGFALYNLNVTTTPHIAKNNANKLAENSKIVMPNAESFEEVVSKLAPQGGGEAIDFTYYKASDASGNLVGYIVPSEGPGFQSTIKVVMGVTPDLKTITGARFSAMETPGFGDVLQDSVLFFGQFNNHPTTAEKQVTNSIDKVDNRSDDPNIETKSGATVSQWAAVRIVNEGLAKIKAVLGDAASTPPAVAEKKSECCGGNIENADCSEMTKEKCKELQECCGNCKDDSACKDKLEKCCNVPGCEDNKNEKTGEAK